MTNLYIVATPIGNLQDMTLRAISTLKSVETIFCEDTRQTHKLLEHYQISNKRLIPLNEFNEENVIFEAIKLLETDNIALVSDAGTPLISDPGYRLVVEAKKRGINIVPIPGPSAVIAALSVAGLPTDRFMFLGFLPKTMGKAKMILDTVRSTKTTVVLYESPHRIVKTLKLIDEIFGDIEVTIERELTKVHEEVITDRVSTFIRSYENKQPKGEFVLLFSSV